MLAEIKTKVEKTGEYAVDWPFQPADADGAIYAEFDKRLYIAKKNFYKEKLNSRI